MGSASSTWKWGTAFILWLNKYPIADLEYAAAPVAESLIAL